MSPQHTTGTHLLAQLLHSGGERGLVGDVALVDREQHGLLLYSSLFGEHTHTHTHTQLKKGINGHRKITPKKLNNNNNN